MKISRHLLFLCVIVLLAFVSYSNIFQNGFVYDDPDFITGNPAITTFSSIPSFFVHPSFVNLYRPLRSVWYTIVYHFSGQNAFGYHLNSLVMHMLVCILIFFITLKITKKEFLAFIVAMLFTLHPIHTDRVTNMSAGFDIPGILLLLLAFYLYIIYSSENKKNYLYFSLGIFVLALLYSEEAVILPFLAILYEFSFGKGKELLNKDKIFSNALVFVPYFLILFGYLLLRTLIIKGVGRISNYITGGLSSSIFTTILIFVKYLYKLIIPINLSLEFGIDVQHSFFGWKVLASLLLLIALIAIAIYSYNKSREVFFAIFWFFIAMLPFTNIFPVMTMIAERYLYVASFGFCLLLGVVLHNLFNIKLKNDLYGMIVQSAAFVLFLVILMSYSSITIQRNSEWKDSISLWTANVKTEPLSSTALNNLGFEYLSSGEHQKAIPLFIKALEIEPTNQLAYENLGSSYYSIGDKERAKQVFIEAVSVVPQSYKSFLNLGLIYWNEKQYDLAIENYKKSISIKSDFFRSHHDIGMIYAELNMTKESDEELMIASKLEGK